LVVSLVDGGRGDDDGMADGIITVNLLAPALAGTIPFKFERFSLSLDGSFLLRLTGEAGVSYSLDASPDLVHWESAVITNSPTGIIQFSQPRADSIPARFFRGRTALPRRRRRCKN
jgi:hypothetical protein